MQIESEYIYLAVALLSTGICATAITIILRKSREQKLLMHESEILRNNLLESQTRLDGLYTLMEQVENVRDEALVQRDSEQQAKIQAEIQVKLAEQEMGLLRKEMGNWEKTKEQHLETAKSSMLKASADMSSKLLEDHKRETELSRKESEKRVQQTTEQLLNQHKNIFEAVKSLNDQVKTSTNKVEGFERALLTPAGAGSLAEITLENVLKNCGLKEKQDYAMQYWIKTEGSGLKPDAVVYLPNNEFLVIDSKASKFFAETNTGDNDDNALKKSMNDRLNELIKRKYKEAIEDFLKSSGNNPEINHIRVLMFLPTDASVERLHAADANFMEKAWQEEILPVGPSGLVSELQRARYIINSVRQEANYRVIIDEVKKLLGSVARLQDLSSGMGKNLRSSLEKYDKFAASFNSNFLSKTRKLEKLGVYSDKENASPQLTRYHISSLDNLIEGEAEEVEEIKTLENAE